MHRLGIVRFVRPTFVDPSSTLLLHCYPPDRAFERQSLVRVDAVDIVGPVTSSAMTGTAAGSPSPCSRRLFLASFGERERTSYQPSQVQRQWPRRGADRAAEDL